MTPTTASADLLPVNSLDASTLAMSLDAGDVLAGGGVTEDMSDGVLIDLARSSHRRISDLASRAAAALREALVAADVTDGEPDISAAGVLELGRLELRVRAPTPKVAATEAIARFDAMAAGNTWLRVRGAPTVEDGAPATLCASVSVIVDQLAAETRRRRAREDADADSVRAAYEQLKARVEVLQRRVEELTNEKARAEERLAAAEHAAKERREDGPRTTGPPSAAPEDLESEVVAEIVRRIDAAGGSVHEIGVGDIERLYPSAARALRDVRDADGRDLLAHMVFRKVKPSRVRMLLGDVADYDVNRQDDAGNTALHYGVRRLMSALDAAQDGSSGDDAGAQRETTVADSTAILRTLLSHPPLDPTLRNAAGQCPVAYAVAHSSSAHDARKRLWAHLRAARLARTEMSRMCLADARESAARADAKRARARPVGTAAAAAGGSNGGAKARKRARQDPPGGTAPSRAADAADSSKDPTAATAVAAPDAAASPGDARHADSETTPLAGGPPVANGRPLIVTPGASDTLSPAAESSDQALSPPPPPATAGGPAGGRIVTPGSSAAAEVGDSGLAKLFADLASHGSDTLAAYIVICCWEALGFATASGEESRAFADAAAPIADTIRGVRAAAGQSLEHAALAARYPHILTEDHTLRVFLDAVKTWVDANPDPPSKYRDRLAMSSAIIGGQPRTAGTAGIAEVVKTMRYAVRATLRDMKREIARAASEGEGNYKK